VHDTDAAGAASFNPTGGVSTVAAPGPGEWLARLPCADPAAQTGPGCRATAASPAGPGACDGQLGLGAQRARAGAMEPPSHRSATT